MNKPFIKFLAIPFFVATLSLVALNTSHAQDTSEIDSLNQDAFGAAGAAATSAADAADQAALDKAIEKANGTNATLKATTKSLFTSGGYKVDSASANLPARVGRVIYIIFAISGTIFLGMVIYSGIRWMTAAGDSDQVKKSRQRIVRASIGLLILLMSYLLANFVLRGLLFGAQSSGGNFQYTAPPGAAPFEGVSGRITP